MNFLRVFSVLVVKECGPLYSEHLDLVPYFLPPSPADVSGPCSRQLCLCRVAWAPYDAQEGALGPAPDAEV